MHSLHTNNTGVTSNSDLNSATSLKWDFDKDTMCSFIILAKVSWSQYKSCFPSHEKKLSWNLNRILLYKIGTCELLDILYFSWIYHIYEILRDILQLLRSLSLNLTDYINLFKAPLRKNRFKKSPPFLGIEKRAHMTNATMLLAFQSLKPIEQFHIHVHF